MTTKRLKGWDQWVQEAQRAPVEVPMPGGEIFTVEQPTGAVAKSLNKAFTEGDNDKVALALFGIKNGRKLIKLCETAPAPVMNQIILDVLSEFNMDSEGDSEASST